MLDEAREKMVQESKKKEKKLMDELQTIRNRKNKANDMFFDGELTRADRDEQINRFNDSIRDLETRIKSEFFAKMYPKLIIC